VAVKAGSQLIKSTALTRCGQTFVERFGIIHISTFGVGNDMLWTTKVNPSRFAGADGQKGDAIRTRAVDNPVNKA
jgi:hypothetical protein